MNIEQEIQYIEKLAEAYRYKRSQRYCGSLLRESFFKWQKATQTFFLEYLGQDHFYYKKIKSLTADKTTFTLSDEFDKFQPICTEVYTLARKKMKQIGIKPKHFQSSNKVFIVHGHDENMKTMVRNYVSSLGLDPIILSEQPGGAATIIEKFEEIADTAAFAVILLSPCDQGRKTGTRKLSYRARQNVVFEFGYFVARLKRERVVALLKDNVERPTDISGVVYIPFDENWQVKLRKEFVHVGLPVRADL